MSNTVISSTSDPRINDDKAITVKPVRVDRITSLSSNQIEFRSHCPDCGSGILVSANGDTLIVQSGRPGITEEQWTNEKVVDELHRHLMGVMQYASNINGEWILVEKYKLQAEGLIYRVPVHEPTPEYIILKSDLTDKLRKELEESTSNEWRQYVLKRAVGRVFAEINSDYYHQNIAPLLKVRLV